MEAANSKSVLMVHAPETKVDRLRELRDFIMESLASGVLVLPDDTTAEIMELPQLGDVEVFPKEELSASVPKPEPPKETALDPEPLSEAEEKRLILQRLKEYWKANGREGLEAVSAKTAYQKRWRVSADTLRELCADVAPKLPIGDWRKISKALDLLEQKEEAHG